MPLVTRTELLEIIPELRALAEVAKKATVRETLTRLADRYAAMARASPDGTTREDVAREFARN